jgi:signal transduction histidine kinase/ActR/RegA family two-component response regulator
MWKRISHYLFKSPDEIGLDNYLVLIFAFLSGILAILGTLINLYINIGIYPVISTVASIIIFFSLYIFSWKTKQYVFSKYVLVILALILLNGQYFINYGSTGPVLYIFVVIESYIIMLFRKGGKIIFTIVVFLNITVLFLIEYFNPTLFGRYPNNEARLMDLYSGMLIYLLLSIFLLNYALKFYQKQKENAQLSDKLKSAFLANMSHEIRTPMNGIMGFAELLKEPNLSGDEQKQYIDVIEKSGERMLNIINDIIDISKIESGLMKTDIRDSNINEQIEYIYSFFRHEVETKGIKFSFHTPLSSEDATIKTDPEKLYAILLNLVKNAIKFTSKGSINFGYRLRRELEPVVLEFIVTDTGIGIPEDRHNAIFERFVQADITDTHAYQGAGLGLSISKAYVEMLNGKIRIESKPGIGTSIYFTIPYNKVPKKKMPADKTMQADEPVEKTKSLKILIAEDDAASEILITREVKKFSNDILYAKTGIEALEICRKTPDIGLILMDIKMPGMDGYEATKEIRKFDTEVIIIAQTAFALPGDIEKALAAGCDDYISKPIKSSSLNAMIREYFIFPVKEDN